MYTLLDGELITNSPPTVSISPSTVNGSIRYIGRGEYGLSANFQEMIFYKKAISSPLIQSVVQSQLDYHSIFRPTESYYYRSLDDVSSFNTPVFSIAYDRNDDIVYLGSTNGVITKWDGLSFTSLGGLLDGIVYTIEFDDIHNILYIGGNFTTLTQPDGSVISSQYIAAWNIDTHTWSSLGSGVDSTVYSLKLNKKNNILYVGGSFTSVISGPIVNHIAFWNINTSSWYGLGSGTNSTVRCIEYDEKNQNVYIGGDFTVVDGSISSNRIAAWNENTSSWSAIIIGLDDVCRALKLDLDTNIMYVGGSFTTAGGLPNTTGIASYNTNSLVWSAIGNGCTTPSVYTIELDSGKNLYIGGNFTISSFPGLRRFSKWNGFSWINFFYDNTVYSIKCDRNNNLYIGGQFINCIEQFVVNDTGIQLYDQKYYPLMNGVDGTVRTITSGRYLSVPTVVKNMYVGGQFINAGGIVTNHIALYDESLNKWYPLVDSGTSGVGVDGDVYTSIYIVYGSTRSLYIGGSFATAGGKPINSLARWDEVSSTWNEISPSLHSSSVVYTISKIPVFDNYVYIGGNIPSVNLIPLNNIVKYSYDTNTWSPLVDTDTLVSGVNGTVFSCELYTSNLYISGDFTSAGGKPISHFARWDELEQKWYDVNDINTGLSVENVNCICGNEFTGQIYVGGSFTSAGGNVANYIAKWNTVLNTWSPLIDSNTGINGLNGPVHSIQINLGVLYITGSFTQAGGLPVNNTVRYDVDTSEFLSVGNGVSNSTSNSVAYTQLIRVIGTSMEPDIMYIGGQFDQFVLNNDDITTNNIAKVSFYNFSNIRF
jgi:hypothetical protein